MLWLYLSLQTDCGLTADYIGTFLMSRFFFIIIILLLLGKENRLLYRGLRYIQCSLHCGSTVLFLGLENNGTITITFSFDKSAVCINRFENGEFKLRLTLWQSCWYREQQCLPLHWKVSSFLCKFRDTKIIVWFCQQTCMVALSSRGCKVLLMAFGLSQEMDAQETV